MFSSRISLGGMRFTDRDSVARIVNHATENGINYVDSCPCYCYHSDQDNSETWLGYALSFLTHENCLSVSTKSRPIYGDLDKEDYLNADGITTCQAFAEMVNRSLKRLGLKKLEWYQLWNINSMKEFEIASRADGWLEGALSAKEKGVIGNLGLTTHGNSEEIINILKTGHFNMVTLPYNLLDTSRKKAIDFAMSKNYIVKAMNPLGGGLLTGKSEKIENHFKELDISSVTELALGFIFSHHGISPLIGVSSVSELEIALSIERGEKWCRFDPDNIYEKFQTLVGKCSNYCTGCNYCSPCPQGIKVSKNLYYYNLIHILNEDADIKAFNDLRIWGEEGYNIEDCTECRLCEQRCPNKLCVSQLLKTMNFKFIGKGLV